MKCQHRDRQTGGAARGSGPSPRSAANAGFAVRRTILKFTNFPRSLTVEIKPVLDGIVCAFGETVSPLGAANSCVRIVMSPVLMAGTQIR